MKTIKKARVEIMETQLEPVMLIEFYVERYGRESVKLVVTGRYELFGPDKLSDLVKRHPNQKFRITRRVFVDPQHMSEDNIEQFYSKMWNMHP